MGWKYYFPSDAETADDARSLIGPRQIINAEHAAELACELDYGQHDGWERGETEFTIAIISPDGAISTFRAYHELSVEHRVFPD